MQPAIAHPDIVEQYLLDEIASDNVAGPFTLTLGGLSHSESIDNLSVVFVGAAQRCIERALGVKYVSLVCHFLLLQATLWVLSIPSLTTFRGTTWNLSLYRYQTSSYSQQQFWPLCGHYWLGTSRLDGQKVEIALQQFYKSGLAASTQKAYSSGQKQFLSFCKKFNLLALPPMRAYYHVIYISARHLDQFRLDWT